MIGANGYACFALCWSKFQEQSLFSIRYGARSATVGFAIKASTHRVSIIGKMRGCISHAIDTTKWDIFSFLMRLFLSVYPTEDFNGHQNPQRLARTSQFKDLTMGSSPALAACVQFRDALWHPLAISICSKFSNEVSNPFNKHDTRL